MAAGNACGTLTFGRAGRRTPAEMDLPLWLGALVDENRPKLSFSLRFGTPSKGAQLGALPTACSLPSNPTGHIRRPPPVPRPPLRRNIRLALIKVEAGFIFIAIGENDPAGFECGLDGFSCALGRRDFAGF